MANILVTGMTASHTSETANERSLSFPGVLALALETQGHTVTLSAPDITWTTEDLERYDKVIVGVAPITSVAAGNTYGGLHVIDILWGDQRLALMVDAPRPLQIGASLRSIAGTPSNLVKPFYSKRRGYAQASEEKTTERLLSVVTRLLEEKWPLTIYPSLPWHDNETVAAQFLPNAIDSLLGLNVDVFLISPKPPEEHSRVARWVVDDLSSPWVEKLIPTIGHPVKPMREKRTDTDNEVSARMSEAIGAIVSPHKEGTWWSYRIMQALNNGTPVVANWRETGTIGESWQVLPSAIESLRLQELADLAWNQLDDYVKSIPSREEANKLLQRITEKTNTKRKVKK